MLDVLSDVDHQESGDCSVWAFDDLKLVTVGLVLLAQGQLRVLGLQTLDKVRLAGNVQDRVFRLQTDVRGVDELSGLLGPGC